MNAKGRQDYAIGEKVVYPNHGVGEIKNVRKQMVMGEKKEYYQIFIPSLDMDILLPVENAKSLGLRGLSSKEEIRKALSSLKEKENLPYSDWKARQNAQTALMKNGDIRSIASVVNILYHRQKVKDLPVMERRIFENALTHLIDETSLVMAISQEDARRTIFARLEKLKPHNPTSHDGS